MQPQLRYSNPYYKKFMGKRLKVLLRLGVIYEKCEYDLALSQYQNIITIIIDGIYSDEALFFCRDL
jgi:hypothetical protein